MSRAWMLGAVAALLLMGGAASAQDKLDIDRRDADRSDRDGLNLERRDDVSRIAGEWTGSYVCAQGVTAMRLVVKPSGGQELRALMHFFAAPDNPDVPEGCFTLTGTFDRNGDLDLHQNEWIIQPPGYRMIGFEGELNRDGTLFRGRVVGPPGCTRFRLTREKVARPLPEACEKAGR